MRNRKPRLALVGTAGALILTTVLGTPAATAVPVAPAPTASVHTPQASDAEVLDITITPDGLTAPATAPPGPVTFRTTTTDPGAGLVGLARLRDGVTWERFRDIQQRTLSSDPAVVVQAEEDLLASADLLGGAVTHPGLPGSFSQRLEPGTYLLFEYFDLENAPQPRYRWLTVTRTGSGQALAPTATLVSEEVSGEPRFTLRGTVRAGQPWRFVNRLPQENEAVFFPLPDNVTETELESYFDAFGDNGEWPSEPPPFDTSKGVGSLPLTPRQSSVLQVPLTPGRYAVITWLKDATDGRTRLVQQGQYAIVEVR
ncbi:hypothetical protein [Streptomyces sparsus]